MTSFKGRNSVANLRKTAIYNTNGDLVNGNVCTKFGPIRSIRSQYIEQKPNNAGMTEKQNDKMTDRSDPVI